LTEDAIKLKAKQHPIDYIQKDFDIGDMSLTVKVSNDIIRPNLTVKKYCVSFSFFEVYNSSKNTIIYKENYDLLRIAVNYIHKYSLTLKKSNNTDTLETYIGKCKRMQTF
jgi:hypothetical protein